MKRGDPAPDQARLPLAEAILRYVERMPARFHTPGHKGRAGTGPLGWWLDRAAELDLTEVPGLDDLHAPTGAIRDAQALAAALWGADATWFSVNGSTGGLQALFWAAAGPADTVLLPRLAHRSAIGGLLVSGARPRYYPITLDQLGLPLPAAPEQVAAALAHCPVRAVLVTSPTYHGRVADVAALASLAHRHGAALIADEAHGAHFGFHPAYPGSSLASGADAAVQSPHKTLAAWTQAAWVHVKGGRLDPERVSVALDWLQTTSPSYLLLASLDLARWQMAREGPDPWGRLAERAQALAAALAGQPGIGVAGDRDPVAAPRDPARLVLDVEGLGVTGWAVADALQSRGVVAETADFRTVVLLLGPWDPPDWDRQLLAAVAAVAAAPPAGPRPPDGWLELARAVAAEWGEQVLPPAEALRRPRRQVALSRAAGHVAAEAISPYPPGTPVTVPGERIRPEAVAYLDLVAEGGGRVQGARDPTLETVQVLA